MNNRRYLSVVSVFCISIAMISAELLYSGCGNPSNVSSLSASQLAAQTGQFSALHVAFVKQTSSDKIGTEPVTIDRKLNSATLLQGHQWADYSAAFADGYDTSKYPRYSLEISKKGQDGVSDAKIANPDFNANITFFTEDQLESGKKYHCTHVKSEKKSDCKFQIAIDAFSKLDEVKFHEETPVWQSDDQNIECDFVTGQFNSTFEIKHSVHWVSPDDDTEHHYYVSSVIPNAADAAVTAKVFSVTFKCRKTLSKKSAEDHNDDKSDAQNDSGAETETSKTVLKGYFLQNVNLVPKL